VTIPLPKEKYYDPLRKQNRLLRSFQDENGKIIRVAHQLIENILQNNQWEYPVYFANMPPAEVAYNLREHCERVGMLYRVTKESKNGAVNVEESYKLTKDVYRIRNLGNPKYYRDETATQMALGMAQLQYDLYDELAKMNDSVRALDVFNDLIEKVPEYSQPAFVHAIVDSTFGIEGKTDQEYKEEYLAFVEELLDYAPDNYYCLQYKGMVLQALGRMEEGIKVLEEAYELMPTSSATYRSLMQAYISARVQSKALEVSRRYLILNPLDQSARRLVNAYGGGQ
jgi:tetratricopeptide (TPR) repeat protein